MNRGIRVSHLHDEIKPSDGPPSTLVWKQSRLTEEEAEEDEGAAWGRRRRAVDWRRPSNILQCHRQAVAALGLEGDPYLPCFTYVLRRQVGKEEGEEDLGKDGEVPATPSSSSLASFPMVKVRFFVVFVPTGRARDADPLACTLASPTAPAVANHPSSHPPPNHKTGPPRPQGQQQQQKHARLQQRQQLLLLLLPAPARGDGGPLPAPLASRPRPPTANPGSLRQYSSPPPPPALARPPGATVPGKSPRRSQMPRAATAG